MQHITLSPQKRHLIEFHTSKENRRRFWFNKLTEDQVLVMLGMRPMRKHPLPFAKRDVGLQRREQRRFIRSRKCAFTCD